MQQQHIINRFTLDVEVADEREANRLQAQWVHRYQEELLQIIEETCDRCVDTEEILFLDDIKLELEALDFSNWSLFKERFQEQFLQKIILHKKIHDKLNLSYNNKESSPISDQISEDELRLRALLHFLKTGNLPWWQVSDQFSIDNTITFLLKEKPSYLKSELQQLTQNNPISIFRLYDALNSETRQKLLQLFGIEESNLLNLSKLLQNKLNFQFISFAQSKEFEKFGLFYYLLNGHFNLAVELIIDEKIVLEAWLAFIEAHPGLFTLPIKDKTNSQYSYQVSDLESFNDENAIVGEIDEHYIISDAGVILLAGFLHRAFRQLGWVKDRSFIDEESRRHAILWLKYLATGEIKHQEYDLTLEKVICGIDPEYYITTEIVFDEAALQEAQNVIESLQAYWSPLQNTSLEGLRQTFFKRRGILQKKNDQTWILQVEHGPYDVLLKLLPPSISLSMIVLPWLKYIIYVEWTQ